MIALATDHTSELDIARLLPEGVVMYVNRVENANKVTLESLKAMEADLTRAASQILPESDVDVIIYSCTSGGIVIGEENVLARIQEGRPGVPCTMPVTAAMKAFEVLDVHSVTLLTPYNDAINQKVRAYFEDHGVSVRAMASFDIATDRDMARVPPAAIRDAALALDRADADAVFISCTALRTIGVIQELEQRLGKPVVTSNQALAWHALRLIGYEKPIPGFGRLMTL